MTFAYNLNYMFNTDVGINIIQQLSLQDAPDNKVERTHPDSITLLPWYP